MKKINILKLITLFLVTISLILVLPFMAVIENLLKDGYKVVFTLDFFKNSKILMSILLVFGVLYFITGCLAIVLKNSFTKWLSLTNFVLGIVIIILLSIEIFTSKLGYNYRLISFFPTLSFLIIDLSVGATFLVLDINAKNVVYANNKVAKVNDIDQFIDNNLIQDSDEAITSNVELKDSTELKNRILNMKYGLNKPYAEAIEEIEQTGTLNGIDMSSFLSDDKEEEDLISNKTLEADSNTNPNYQNQQIDIDWFDDKANDPLSIISEDYESIHSSKLSRQDSKPEYTYISRRTTRGENKH